MKTGKEKSAPLNACIFDSDPQVVKFTEAELPEEKTFSIVAYSGGIIPNHWFWGNVAFDLSGVTFDKPVTPVLDSHVASNRMGYTTKQETEGKIYVEGKFLSNPKALELQNDIRDGFPIQASPYLPPDEVEFVAEGEKTEVNGLTLKGPGAVFRKARIKDISFCTFGADSQTAGKVFDKEDNNEVKFNLFVKEKEIAKVSAKKIASAVSTISKPAKTKTPTPEEKFTAEFNADEKIRSEFGGAEGLVAYVSFRKADERGLVKIPNRGESLSFSRDDLKDDPDIEAEQRAKDEKKYTDEFNASKETQAEFRGEVKDYIAYRKNEELGAVGIC